MNFSEYFAQAQNLSIEESMSWIAFLRSIREDLLKPDSGLANYCRRRFAILIDAAAKNADCDAPSTFRDTGRAQAIHELPTLLRNEMANLEVLYDAWQQEMNPDGQSNDER